MSRFILHTERQQKNGAESWILVNHMLMMRLLWGSFIQNIVHRQFFTRKSAGTTGVWCLEKFYDAKYIDSRDGKKRSGQELFNGRISRNHKKDSENLHQYRLQKVTPGRRAIRRQHYPIQPHDIIVYNGNKIEVSGCQHKGTRVVFSKTKKSVQISKIKLFKYAGGYSKSVFN